jgi:hypothetical protein
MLNNGSIKPLMPPRDGENVEMIPSSLWKVVFGHQETPHTLFKKSLTCWRMPDYFCF